MIQNEPYYLHAGKLEQVLPKYPDNFFDSVVWDPPYGIGFMGKEWDTFKHDYKPDKFDYSKDAKHRHMKSMMAGKYDRSVIAAQKFQLWIEDKAAHVLRVLKPGGYLLSFSSPRMYHRMVCGFEDAGFEIRDQIFWVFASGFPKSLNLEGQYEGWGTALKPAHEPIMVARKPLDGTVLNNMQTYGTGAMNIAECRIEGEPWTFGSQTDIRGGKFNTNKPSNGNVHAKNVTGGEDGRWPANLIHDGSEEVLKLFPYTKSGKDNFIKETGKGYQANAYGKRSQEAETQQVAYGDQGSAARFFYCAKVAPSDRHEGLTDIKNAHPTVKPTALMRYLVKLVTPKGGICLDPTMGSGSTGKACMLEHMRFVGIDKDPQNIPIAEGRIQHALKNRDNQITLFS